MVFGREKMDLKSTTAVRGKRDSMKLFDRVNCYVLKGTFEIRVHLTAMCTTVFLSLSLSFGCREW